MSAEVTARRDGGSWRLYRLRRVPTYFFLTVWSAFTIVCLSYVILGSFKTQRELLRFPWDWPQALNLKNFAHAWTVAKLDLYLINSTLVVAGAVLVILIVSAPAAYVLSRGTFRFRHGLTTYLILGMGIPIPLLYIPLFALFSQLGLANNLFGLGLAFVVTSIPFTTYLLTGFFSGVPSAIGDAATMDGATDWQKFAHVYLPLGRSGLITAAIFNTIWLWNEYQLTIVLVTDQDKKTLPLGLFALQSATQYSGNWTQLYAGVTIVVVPTLVAFIVLSEKMIAGMTAGAVK